MKKSESKKKPVRSEKLTEMFKPEFNDPNRELKVLNSLKHKINKDGVSIEGF